MWAFSSGHGVNEECTVRNSRFFLFSKTFRIVLKPIQRPILWSPEPKSWPVASRPITGPISWPLALRQITRTRILTSRLKADYRAQILTSPLKADYWGPNRDLSPQGRLVELCLHGALCLLCMQKCNLTCILLCCTRFRNPEGMRRFRSDVKMKLKETGPTL